MKPMKPLILIAALTLVAGAAHAEVSRADAAAARFAAEPAPQPLLKAASQSTSTDLSDPALFRVSNRDDAPPVRPKGTVQTAIDHSFSSKSTGSVGYLCGLQPGPNEAGGVRSSTGPVGTFLGGQFKVAF